MGPPAYEGSGDDGCRGQVGVGQAATRPIGRVAVAGRDHVEGEQRGPEHRRRVEDGDLGGGRDGSDPFGRRAR